MTFPDRLRVLMVAPTPYFGHRGCHIRIYNEVRALQDLGHQVRTVTYHLGDDPPGTVVKRIPRVPGYDRPDLGPSWGRPLLDLAVLARAGAELRRFRPDIVHGHLHEGAFIAGAIGRATGVGSVGDLQGGLVAEAASHGFLDGSSPLGLALGMVERLASRLPDLIVVGSEVMAEHAASCGVSAGRILVVPDGAGPVETAPSRLGQAQARRHLGVPVDAEVTAYVGLLTAYQGIDLLLDMVPEVAARRPRSHFLVVGFPGAERYRREAERRGLEELVTFTGRLSYFEIREALAAADIAVTPKLLDRGMEGNLKLAGFRAAGLPTVAFDYPVNRELMGDGCLYAAPGDREGMTGLLVELLGDPERRLGMKRAMERQGLPRHLRWEHNIETLLGAYCGLVGSRGRGGTKW